MLKRIFHRCRPELVAINDQYHTTFSSGKSDYHQMRFYRCECGKRSFKTDYPYEYSKHTGIEKAKQNWFETGVVPEKSYHPSQSKYYVQVDDLEAEKLDPILEYRKVLEELNKTLAITINRDFNLELKYPALKKAADEYHKQLDKYRTFEKLKGGN